MSLTDSYVPCIHPAPHLAKVHRSDKTWYRVIYNDRLLNHGFKYLHLAHALILANYRAGVTERPVLEIEAEWLK